MSKLTKSTIINGANSLAVALLEGIVYRIQPVEEVTPIVFENFRRNRVKDISLDSVISQDYKVVGITVDFADDDRRVVDDEGNNIPPLETAAFFRIFKPDSTIESIRLLLTSHSDYTNPLYLNHNDIWLFRFSEKIDKITFYCVPVIINPPIISRQEHIAE